jgi:hypothetical protein
MHFSGHTDVDKLLPVYEQLMMGNIRCKQTPKMTQFRQAGNSLSPTKIGGKIYYSGNRIKCGSQT